jgi:hypothetical protein
VLGQDVLDIEGKQRLFLDDEDAVGSGHGGSVTLVEPACIACVSTGSFKKDSPKIPQPPSAGWR